MRRRSTVGGALEMFSLPLYKRRHYPIIPAGMRFNIKGRWQPGHQRESFHWFIIYTVT